MSNFNYKDYLRNNPLTEQLESDEDFGTGGEEVESLAADVVMGRISYKDAREKADKKIAAEYPDGGYEYKGKGQKFQYNNERIQAKVKEILNKK